MAKFIEPNVIESHRNYIGKHINYPVNIDLCTELKKYDEPDGYGTNYPVLNFKGCGVIWYFGEKGHKERDEMYNKILTLPL